MVADVFIRRPVLSSVCSLLIILAGAISIPTLPIARFPDLAPPSVTVAAFYTGANAQAVETAVTTPLEQAINGVEGMTYMTSSSTSTGFSTVSVFFDVGRDPDLAAVEVQNRVNQALGRLPADVRTNGISVTKNTAGFMGGIGFFSADNRYDNLFLSNYIDLYVKDAIKRVPGVGNVIIFGERRFAMRLWLDPTKLASRGLTPADVLNALREQNVQVAAGALGDAPASANQAFTLSVRAMGRLSEASEFANVVVSAGKGGALVRVKDVGRVELGAETYASNLRFIGLEAMGVGIALLPRANAIDVYNGVVAELTRLERNFPPGLEWRMAFDNVQVVRESIIEVLWTLLEAIGLVILVMFLFLQNWRSTVIPAITIPVSLIGTFGFIKLFDFSINTLTLFGIVLATGIVVDDAIVVIENIERHMAEEKKSARRAASDAMREVFGAVLVIGIVLVAVFVPVAFFPGVTGRLYQQFSLTIAFAVVLSVFNAVTLTPALSALLLDRESHEHGRFFTAVNRVIDGGTSAYVWVVRRALGWRWAMIILFIGGLFATYSIFRLVPTAFVPNEDEGYFMSVVQAPAGASLEYTTEIAKQAEKILFADPDILAAFSVMGFSFTGAAPNNGMIFARLKDYGERPGPEHSLQAVLNRVSGQLFGIPGAIVMAFAPPALQGISLFGGFQFEVLDQTGNADIGGLAAATFGLMGAGNQSGRVTGLFSTFRADDPQLLVDIDRDKARSLGLPLREVTDALQVFLGSQYVNDFDFNNRAYRVYVQADQSFRADPSDLKQLYARASSGEMIPLDSVVRLRETTAPQVISHFNLFRSATLTGNPAPGQSSGQAIQSHGGIGADEPAARLRLRVVRTVARRDQGRHAGRLYLRPESRARLPRAGGAVRELGAAVHHPAWRSTRGPRGAQRAAGPRLCQRRLLSGRARPADRTRRQELDSDRRVRGTTSGEGAVDRRRRRRIGAHPAQTDSDDVVCVHPRRLAAGACDRCRRSGPKFRRHRGGGRNGGLDVPLDHLHSSALRRDPDAGAGPGASRPRHRRGCAGSGRVGPVGWAPPERPASCHCSSCVWLSGNRHRTAGGRTLPMERLDFDAAIARAIEKNPTVAIASTNILRSEGILQQVRSTTLPQVGFAFTNSTLDAGRSFDEFTVQPQNQSLFAANVTVPVLQAAGWAARNQAADQVEISRLAVVDVRRQIAVSAAQAYLNIINLKRQVEVQLRALETAQAQLDYNQKRVQGGVGTRLNELRSAQEVATNEARLELFSLAVRRAQEALGVLLAEPGPVDTTVEPAFEIPPPAPETEWFAARPDLRLFGADAEAARRVVADSSKDWWPTANVSFDPQYITPGSIFQPAGSWRLTLQVAQPLYDSGSRQGVRRQREAALESAQLVLTEGQIQARSEERLARETIASQERSLASARRAAEHANEVLKITIIAFDAGASTNIEVVDAQRSARDLETAVTQVEDAVRQARLDLLVALGRFPR